MEIEKEIRFIVSDDEIKIIRKNSKTVSENSEQIDLTLGYSGFDSLEKYGYVCRVRNKSNKIWMEIKNRNEDGSFFENKIYIENFQKGVDFFNALGMKPYMYMKRNREILEYQNLKIFIDDIELLGKYVEIEYQDAKNNEIDDFYKMLGRIPITEQLYGDIIKEKIVKDKKFNEIFQRKLREFIKSV